MVKENFLNVSGLIVRGIYLIPVHSPLFTTISSAIEKEAFIRSHKLGTYKFHRGGALVEQYRYMLIDPSLHGHCLTPTEGVTYNAALRLIDMYL